MEHLGRQCKSKALSFPIEMSQEYINDLKEALGLKTLPSFFPDIYKRKLEDGTLFDDTYATEEYIKGLNDKYGLFNEKYLGCILSSAEKMRERCDLIAFMNIVSEGFSDKETYLERVKEITMPAEPDEEADFMFLFAILPLVESQYKGYLEHDLPDEIIKASLNRYQWGIQLEEMRTGKPAFDFLAFRWCLRFAHGRILRIEQLEFEMVTDSKYNMIALENKTTGEIKILADNVRVHPSGMIVGAAGFEDDGEADNGNRVEKVCETEFDYIGCAANKMGRYEAKPTSFLKSEWRKIYSPGDHYVSVHIPRNSKIDDANRHMSYDAAKALFAKLYPEFHPVMMHGSTWIFDPKIEEILGDKSNLVGFKHDFSCYPVASSGTEVIRFVFFGKYSSPEEYPEDTRLRREVKAYLLAGNRIHAYGGVCRFGDAFVPEND